LPACEYAFCVVCRLARACAWSGVCFCVWTHDRQVQGTALWRRREVEAEKALRAIVVFISWQFSVFMLRSEVWATMHE
jgi:hypothetical protein